MVRHHFAGPPTRLSLKSGPQRPTFTERSTGAEGGRGDRKETCQTLRQSEGWGKQGKTRERKQQQAGNVETCVSWFPDHTLLNCSAWTGGLTHNLNYN